MWIDGIHVCLHEDYRLFVKVVVAFWRTFKVTTGYFQLSRTVSGRLPIEPWTQIISGGNWTSPQPEITGGLFLYGLEGALT